MAGKLKLISGSTIRWGARRFVVVDYVGLDAVIAREVGKRIRFAGGKLRNELGERRPAVQRRRVRARGPHAACGAAKT